MKYICKAFTIGGRYKWPLYLSLSIHSSNEHLLENYSIILQHDPSTRTTVLSILITSPVNGTETEKRGNMVSNCIRRKSIKIQCTFKSLLGNIGLNTQYFEIWVAKGEAPFPDEQGSGLQVEVSFLLWDWSRLSWICSRTMNDCIIGGESGSYEVLQWSGFHNLGKISWLTF
jgi:hypothetical protein